MGWMIYAGIAVTLAGLAGLVWCIVSVVRAKRSGMEDDALKAHLARMVSLNMGSLFVATFGLMIVIMGLFLR